jgi:hypothetical protein
MVNLRRIFKLFNTIAAIGLLPNLLLADTQSYTSYGTIGLIDMPTAASDSDGRLILSQSGFDGDRRTSLTAQILPRLSASFRYSAHGRNGNEAGGYSNHDRSFDLRFRAVDEGQYMPAFAIGLNDFIGTGWYTGEYVVGTKNIGPVEVTAGLGFGRLATYGGFDSPLGQIDQSFKTRAGRDVGVGGELEATEWFQGDTAAFGGLAWHLGKGLTAKFEYSSDRYNRETSYLEHQTPWNYGLTWNSGKGYFLQSSFLHGDKIALSAHLVMDPKDPPNGPGRELAPIPLRQKVLKGSPFYLESTNETVLKTVLKADGFKLTSLDLEQNPPRLRLVNQKYRSTAQALGRAARTASRYLSDNFDSFYIEFIEDDLVILSAEINRDQLIDSVVSAEPSEKFLDTVTFQDTTALGFDQSDSEKFSWSIGPYVEYSLFDPLAPIRGEVGAELFTQYTLGSGFYIDGRVRKSVVGNFDKVLRQSNSVLPHVRSDHDIYARDGDPGIDQLTITKVNKIMPSVYGKLTAGYLEKMFAGVSGEILWKPISSSLGLGIELSQVQQRNFDMLWGLQNYQVTTGHLSAYYFFKNGFMTQLDAGQYLAGDRGYTLRVGRKFGNGWHMGAYATVTNVPFAKFGEGSYDKGIFAEIPLDWSIGSPYRTTSKIEFNVMTRDGGAKLHTPYKLHKYLFNNDKNAIYHEAGRLWK